MARALQDHLGGVRDSLQHLGGGLLADERVMGRRDQEGGDLDPIQAVEVVR
jgi:hypothetical protein